MKYPVQKTRRIWPGRRMAGKTKRPIPRVVVPSFFTLMNLFCGFVSLILVAGGNYTMGAWLIVLAGLFDALDGVMARLANATSDFGIELDSICDVVSFGVAPGFLVYNFGLNQLGLFGIILSALLPLCGAIRLARFNVDSHFGYFEDFKGLPTPVQAIMMSAFVLTFVNSPSLFEEMQFGVATVMIPIVILLSFLMISAIPFDKLPRFDRKSFKTKKAQFLLFLFYMSVIILFQEYGLMFVFTLYILKGLVSGAWLLFNNGIDDEKLPV